MKSDEKTNVLRLLESRKIPHTAHTYEPNPALTGEEIARLLGENPDHVFKTLVTRGKSGRFFVFVIPVPRELDLKKAAKAAGDDAASGSASSGHTSRKSHTRPSTSPSATPFSRKPQRRG